MEGDLPNFLSVYTEGQKRKRQKELSVNSWTGNIAGTDPCT
jgi:hypothetical protein